MLRILSFLAALAMASTTALVAGTQVVAPAMSNSTTSSITSPAKVAEARPITASLTQSTAAATTVTAQGAAASATTTSVTSTGNGARSGPHYNLNIIGTKAKTGEMNNNDGHRIFVLLKGGQTADSLQGTNFANIDKVNKIFLVPDTSVPGDFNVIDANATDSSGAIFQLPADVSTKWVVYARALGKPGGKASMTTCATLDVIDPLTGVTTQEVVCSIATLSLERKTGGINTKFQNVTDKLLFATLAADSPAALACGTTTVALFADCLQNYFWNYDNNGLKLLQLRFYPAV